MKKKLYLVKREVKATSLRAALGAKGRIYSVVEVDESQQPSDKPPIGFKKGAAVETDALDV